MQDPVAFLLHPTSKVLPYLGEVLSGLKDAMP